MSILGSDTMASTVTDLTGLTSGHHRNLPRLPVPALEDSARKYLRALEGLQDAKEHEATKRAIDDFLRGDGPRLQQKLLDYAATRDR